MLVYTRGNSLAENRAMRIDRFLRILEITQARDLNPKIHVPSQRHPGILNGGKTVSSRGYSGHVERTITCHVHLLQPTPKERTTTNTERTYLKDVTITINI